jgi:hypothetical protein
MAIREEPFPQQHGERGAFVRKIKLLEIHVTTFAQVTYHLVVIRSRLNDNALSPAVIQKQVM